MPIKTHLLNSTSHYGYISIVLHWLMAFVLIGMYVVGNYMVDLDYYDTWYHQAPALHKATGIILGFALVFRIIWNYTQKKPASFEKKPILMTVAKLGHLALYLFIISLTISGYLISTAKGQGINILDLFKFPALLPDNPNRGEIAGDIHEIIGLAFILMVALHATAALTHHFIFKNRTLKRMLWVKTTSK